MTVRRALLVAGLLVAGAGLALAVAPGLAPDLRVPTVAFAALGVLAAVAGAAVTVDRLRPASPTAPPERPAVAVPGEAFDRRLAGLSARDDDAVAAVREEVRAAAVAALVRHRGHPPAEARALVRSGDWTDDGAAAAFLAEAEPEPPRLAWLRTLATGEPRAARRARRAVDAVHRVVAGGDR